MTVYDTAGYAVSSSAGISLSAKMSLPFLITRGAKLSANTSVPTSGIVITIQFFIVHDVPPDSTLVIDYPLELSPSNVTVTSPQTTSLNGVIVAKG